MQNRSTNGRNRCAKPDIPKNRKSCYCGIPVRHYRIRTCRSQDICVLLGCRINYRSYPAIYTQYNRPAHLIPDSLIDVSNAFFCLPFSRHDSLGGLFNNRHSGSEVLHLFRNIQFHQESPPFRNLAAQQPKPNIPFSRLITDTIFECYCGREKTH